MGILAERRERRAAEAEERSRFDTFANVPVLNRLRPRERYVFHSDYFDIDDCVACILTFTHNESSMDNFGPFWGVNRIPRNMPDGVVTINLEQISRKGESWVQAHQAKAEAIAETDINEQSRNGTISTRGKASSRARDMEVIGRELNNGASYLQAQCRILVKAPSIEVLDEAVTRIERLCSERFSTIGVMAYTGDQRYELSTLLSKNEVKRGRGMYATSVELAGSYDLVTHGLEDVGGEYVGTMTGDISNAGVIFDVDNWTHHVVVASDGVNHARGRASVSDMWGAKIAQAALMNNHKVVHILLNDVDLTRLGPAFSAITAKLDMNAGELNPFEMFGESADELSVFPSQMRKLVLLAEQTYATTDADRAIISGTLEEIATQFYVDRKMWFRNAAENRRRLRVVGIPHKDVPLLHDFCAYLDMQHKAALNASSPDPEKQHAVSVLRMAFRNLLSNNGDLFDNPTSDKIDGIVGARRVVYDFSGMARRGQGVIMAQLVNVIDLAVSQCKAGDVVIFHGAAEIADEGVRAYVTEQFRKLWRRGGRVAFCYPSVSDMLDASSFNLFDSASYTVLGNMTDNLVERYQDKLGQNVPADLASLVTNKSEAIMYIRRGYDNVVFHQDLQLDVVDRRKFTRKR